MKSRNKMDGWKLVTPLHNKFVSAMIACSCHLIVTMRTKTEWVFEQDNGKTIPKKVGTKPIQREGIDYEFDIVCDLNCDHELHVGKTRCQELDGLRVARPDMELGRKIRAWLKDQPTMSEVVSQCCSAIQTEFGFDPELARDKLRKMVVEATVGRKATATDVLAAHKILWEDLKSVASQAGV
jgi:hypothetical protein